jgi:hypothetical protein
MATTALPTHTVLDGPERDSLLTDSTAATLKAVLLLQPIVPELRAQGLSDTEIINTMVELMNAGMVRLIEHDGRVGLVPTNESRAKRRPRRRP